MSETFPKEGLIIRDIDPQYRAIITKFCEDYSFTTYKDIFNRVRDYDNFKNLSHEDLDLIPGYHVKDFIKIKKVVILLTLITLRLLDFQNKLDL